MLKTDKSLCSHRNELRVPGPAPLFPVKYHKMHISYDCIASATRFLHCVMLRHLLSSASWHCYPLLSGDSRRHCHRSLPLLNSVVLFSPDSSRAWSARHLKEVSVCQTSERSECPLQQLAPLGSKVRQYPLAPSQEALQQALRHATSPCGALPGTSEGRAPASSASMLPINFMTE